MPAKANQTCFLFIRSDVMRIENLKWQILQQKKTQLDKWWLIISGIPISFDCDVIFYSLIPILRLAFLKRHSLANVLMYARLIERFMTPYTIQLIALLK